MTTTGYHNSLHSTSTLHREDFPRISRLLDRVRNLMLDGEWRSLRDIQQTVGGSEAGVSARLRDLRRPEHGGHLVEHRRQDGGLWVYRVSPRHGQGELFT